MSGRSRQSSGRFGRQPNAKILAHDRAMPSRRQRQNMVRKGDRDRRAVFVFERRRRGQARTLYRTALERQGRRRRSRGRIEPFSYQRSSRAFACARIARALLPPRDPRAWNGRDRTRKSAAKSLGERWSARERIATEDGPSPAAPRVCWFARSRGISAVARGRWPNSASMICVFAIRGADARKGSGARAPMRRRRRGRRARFCAGLQERSEAIADLNFRLCDGGARARQLKRHPRHPPRRWGRRAAHAQGQKTRHLFGRNRTGLDNEEVA